MSKCKREKGEDASTAGKQGEAIISLDSEFFTCACACTATLRVFDAQRGRGPAVTARLHRARACTLMNGPGWVPSPSL